MRHSGGNGPVGTTVVRSMGRNTVTGWQLVQAFYGNRRPDALEAAAGFAFSQGAAAAAPAREAYGRPHWRQKNTGPCDEDGLLEGLERQHDDVL